MDHNYLVFNPYQGQNFFEFIVHFFQRIFFLLTGQLPFHRLASDEIQVLVLCGVAISSAMVGTFLVLRRMTMLANSLSHTILMGIVIAYFFSTHIGLHEHHHSIPPMTSMLVGSLIMGFITAFLTEFLTKKGRLQEDASTGLVFTSLFALGVILVTVLTRDAHIGTEAIMGNVDALHLSDLSWVYLVAFVNFVLFALFFKEFQITSFDSSLSLAMGISPFLFNYLLMAQVSATSITSFRAVGVLLVLAFMTGPALAARLFTRRLKSMMILACLFGILCSLFGVAFSRHFLSNYGIALSTSGVVVSTILVFYFFCIIIFALLKVRKVLKVNIPI